MNSLPDHIQAKIQPEPNSGCWLWTGRLSSRGYGMFRQEDRSQPGAHRVIFEMLVGEIPEGLVLDHLCRVHCCVNPDHLEAVTQGENVRRGHRHNGEPLSPEERRRRKLSCQLRWRLSPAGRAAKLREYEQRRLRENSK